MPISAQTEILSKTIGAQDKWCMGHTVHDTNGAHQRSLKNSIEKAVKSVISIKDENK